MFKPLKKKHWGKKLFLAGLILIGAGLRFSNINWDDNLISHPDERNIASAVARISFFDQMNPKFFAYNGLPIYLYRLIGEGVNLLTHSRSWTSGWEKINLIGRSISALSSTLSLILIYQLAKILFKKSTAGTWALGFTVFCAALIQTAHYGVTESLLTFWVLLISWLSLKYWLKPSKKKLALLTLISGLSLATKTSAITFLATPVLVLIGKMKTKAWPKTLVKIPLFLLASLVVFFIFSPYNILSWPKFMESMNYEGGIVNGRLKVVYVLQFLKTLPYIFHLKNLLWQMGPALAGLGLIGLIMMWLQASKTNKKSWLIFLAWPTIYLLIVGSWYAKFVRYLVPAIPFLCLTAGWLADQLYQYKQKLFKLFLALTILTTAFWGTAVANIYSQQGTRLAASHWLLANVQSGATILNEHWDDGLPKHLEHMPNPDTFYSRKILTIYDNEGDKKSQYLAQELSQADWVVLASRRLWGTIINLPEKYPVTSQYYRLLFAEQLGYRLVKEFTTYPQFLGLTVPTDQAEETFQVYDHPHIFVFQNQERLNQEELVQRLTNPQPPEEINFLNSLVLPAWAGVGLLLITVILKLLPSGFARRAWFELKDLFFDKTADQSPIKTTPIGRREIIILALILFLASALRFYRLSQNPAGFFCDEAANGYNAYTLLTSGRDEYGQAWPFYFRSFGDYRNPVTIYSMIPMVAVFGLNEFSIRGTIALMSTATVLLLFLFVRELFWQKPNFVGSTTALAAALFLAISPWHIHFSRTGFEFNTMPFFLILALFLFLRFIHVKHKRWLWLSMLFFAVTFYTYYPIQIVLIIFLSGLIFIYKKNLFSNKNLAAAGLGILIFLLGLIPFILGIVNNQALSRFYSVSPFNNELAWKTTLTNIAQTYFNHFSFNFLFTKGDLGVPGHFITRHAVKNIGELYFFQLPLLLIGLIGLFIKERQIFKVILLWLMLFPIGSAVVANGPFAHRSIFGVAVFQIISGYGLTLIYGFFKNLPWKNRTFYRGINIFIFCLLAGVILASTKHYVQEYFVNYPLYSADYWGWQYGSKEIIHYFNQVEPEFDELIFSHQFNAPEIFLKFYAPAKYYRYRVGNLSSFNPDKTQLFALSPDEFRQADINKIHKIIYYPNNKPAFYLVEINGIKHD